jgi:hypothetical protein
VVDTITISAVTIVVETEASVAAIKEITVEVIVVMVMANNVTTKTGSLKVASNNSSLT